MTSLTRSGPAEINQVPWPDNMHDRAMFRCGPIGQRNRSAGALQQGLGDEEAEAHALMAAGLSGFFAIAWPCGHEGIAQPVEDVLVKTRSVVADGQ